MKHELPIIWSDNQIDLFQITIVRLRAQLKDALACIDNAPISGLYQAVNQINEYMSLITTIYNQQKSRAALETEIRLLRSGVGISYATGSDPTEQNHDQ